MASTEPAEPVLARPKSFSYRVRGIPENLDIYEVTALLELSLEVTNLEVKSLARSLMEGQEQVATITLNAPSGKLQRQSDKLEITLAGLGSISRYCCRYTLQWLYSAIYTTGRKPYSRVSCTLLSRSFPVCCGLDGVL